MHIEATIPDPIDTIYITSPLHKTTSVSFRIANVSKKASEFTATFTPESDSEFGVQPRQGYLEPETKEGTSFVVSFTPVEYGKMKIGTLIIQTEEMYWSYHVKGNFPKYVPPKMKSNIQNKLSFDIERRLQSKTPRNFLQENIKRTGSNSPKARSMSPKKEKDVN